MFQEIIKHTQIGQLDGHVRWRRKLGLNAGQGDHGLGRKWFRLSQQMPQRVVHRRFAVAGGMLQNPQVGPLGNLGRVLVPQPVVRDPKVAGGEQVLAITVILEGAGLTHQLIDNVPIVHRVLVASHQPRQRVDEASRVPDFHAVGMQPSFDRLADQAAVDRVDIAVNVNQAPAVDAHRQP